MERHGIPTARAVVVHSLEAANGALDEWKGPVVVKADGLAAGKGVVMTPDVKAARAVLADWYRRRTYSGRRLRRRLEERLEGREVSVFALCDGRAIVPFGAACDYKRAGDGDTGPNTGGMGAYSPPAGFPDDLYDRVRERILAPLLRGLLAEGDEYVGVHLLRTDVDRRTGRTSSSSTRVSVIPRRKRCCRESAAISRCCSTRSRAARWIFR